MKTALVRALVLCLLVASLPVTAADLQIVVSDPAGQGFNDPTPASPVGGNMGTTVGAQRLNVFKEAARIWGSLLPSDVTIKIDSSFQPLDCDATSAVLGAAGATTVHANFPNAPVPNTWYNKPQADKLAGSPVGTNPASIQARFNSNLGQSGCLAGTFFYLGLDTNHGNNIDLLVVLLHEFGHGLGFTSQVDSDGKLLGTAPNAFPGIFDRFLLDTSTGKMWDQMTDSERFASGTNAPFVVWNGANTATFAKANQGPSPRVLVNSPASVAGAYAVGTAAFGGVLSDPGVTADVVAAQDAADAAGPSTTDGCSAFSNAVAMAGKIALIDRGTCAFVVKAKNAQNAGAVGAVIVNNVPGGTVGMSGTDATITIPVVMVAQTDGNAIRAALPANANIGSNLALLAGADSSARLLMYAPNPYIEASSISHWDRSALPNLLMEPNISDDLGLNVDATLPALRDMGWFLGSTTLPTTWVLPSSAHAQGANNAFYTTGLTITNTGTSDASVTLKFLGHDQDGTVGAEQTRAVLAGATLTLPDVLGSVFGLASGFGAIRINGTTNNFKIVSQTSTPPPSGVGTFGQAVPALTGDDLATPAATKALFSLRQDAAFRTNAVIANTTAAAAHVDMKLFSATGGMIGSGAADLAPLEMRQITSVITALGGQSGTKDAVLWVSTPTEDARIATYAAVIDQQTNDPRTILPVTVGKLGANQQWLLPSSAHAQGANNAFYTTDLTVGNTGTTDASVTLKFLGHDQNGSSGPQVVRNVPANSAVTFTDVLGSLFSVSSGFGAILVTANSADVRVLSQTSTPPPSGVGTFGQSVPAAGPANFVTLAAPKALVGMRQDAAFRTNAVIANATNLPTHVDFTLKSETGAVLGTSSYDLQPYEMRQINGVVTALGAPSGTANATLLVSTTTTGGRVATYAAIIDQTTNDPRTVLP
jgi:hypothetical protein